MNNLATTLLVQGDLVDARDLVEQVLEARSRILGPEHPDTLGAMNGLALTLLGQGDLTGARDLFEQVLEASTRTLGPEHPSTLRTKDMLAMTLAALDEEGTLGPAGTLAAEEEPPAAGPFAPAGSLAEARADHTATLLADGRVLVVGGFGPFASAEVWDPVRPGRLARRSTRGPHRYAPGRRPCPRRRWRG